MEPNQQAPALKFTSQVFQLGEKEFSFTNDDLSEFVYHMGMVLLRHLEFQRDFDEEEPKSWAQESDIFLRKFAEDRGVVFSHRASRLTFYLDLLNGLNMVAVEEDNES